jgi:hypothetical protein
LVKFCSDTKDKIECLKQQDVRMLTPGCRKMVFEEEEEEVLQNTVDHSLVSQEKKCITLVFTYKEILFKISDDVLQA